MSDPPFQSLSHGNNERTPILFASNQLRITRRSNPECNVKELLQVKPGSEGTIRVTTAGCTLVKEASAMGFNGQEALPGMGNNCWLHQHPLRATFVGGGEARQSLDNFGSPEHAEISGVETEDSAKSRKHALEGFSLFLSFSASFCAGVFQSPANLLTLDVC